VAGILKNQHDETKKRLNAVVAVDAQWPQGKSSSVGNIARSAGKIFTGDGETVRDCESHRLTVSCEYSFFALRAV
jgi:hypothetical protein